MAGSLRWQLVREDDTGDDDLLVFDGERLVASLVRASEPRRAWWWVQPGRAADVRDSMYETWEELLELDFDLSWWRALVDCPTCGALAWEPCTNPRTGSPNKWCHRDRRMGGRSRRGSGSRS